MEYLDILDERGNKTGEIKPRKFNCIWNCLLEQNRKMIFITNLK